MQEGAPEAIHWSAAHTTRSRSLLDARDTQTAAVVDADINIVSTAAQFQAAIMEGAQDIELRSHVDLSELALAFTSGSSSLVLTALGDVRASTRSIRVCTIPHNTILLCTYENLSAFHK